MNCAEFQTRFSTGRLKREHVLHGKDNLNFRSALLCHAGLVERDVVAAIRASEFKLTFLFNSRQGLKAKLTLIERRDSRKIANVQNDSSSRCGGFCSCRCHIVVPCFAVTAFETCWLALPQSSAFCSVGQEQPFTRCRCVTAVATRGRIFQEGSLDDQRSPAMKQEDPGTWPGSFAKRWLAQQRGQHSPMRLRYLLLIGVVDVATTFH